MPQRVITALRKSKVDLAKRPSFDARRGDRGGHDRRAHARFRRGAVARDQLVIVVGPEHPWSEAKASLSGKDDLLDVDWVLREPGSGARSGFERALEALSLSPHDLRVALELPSNEAVRLASQERDRRPRLDKPQIRVAAPHRCPPPGSYCRSTAGVRRLGGSDGRRRDGGRPIAGDGLAGVDGKDALQITQVGEHELGRLCPGQNGPRLGEEQRRPTRLNSFAPSRPSSAEIEAPTAD